MSAPATESLQNKLGWSRSRDRLLTECARKYYYSYYGAWGGWEGTADPRTRELWLLKQVQSRHMWVGDLVHRTCALALRYARHHGEMPPEADLVRRVDHDMRAEFRLSRDGAMHERSAREPRLHEHEFDETVSDGEWRTMHRRAVDAVRRFVASDVLVRILAVPRSRWLSIEAHGSFEVDGVPVLGVIPVNVRLDFACREGDDVLIVDWKTGARPGTANRVQLACYALYAHRTWRVPVENVRALEVNLVRNETHEHVIEERDIALTERFIRDSARTMIGVLDDAEANVASESSFAKAESMRVCGRCAFQRPCLGGAAREVLGKRTRGR